MGWDRRGEVSEGGGGRGKVGGKVGGDGWRGRRGERTRERTRDGAKTGVIRCVWQGLAASIARSSLQVLIHCLVIPSPDVTLLPP